jgi:hypothetical protein
MLGGLQEAHRACRNIAEKELNVPATARSFSEILARTERNKDMADPGTLSTIASIISAFGAAMLFFRIQRELQMRKSGERVWLPVPIGYW